MTNPGAATYPGSMTLPGSGDVPPPDSCWPIDWGCNPKADEMDPQIKRRAELFALFVLRGLTLGQVGNCPSTVRPCSERCNPGLYQVGPTFQPYISGGQWLNAVCGCGASAGGCGCGRLPTVILPGPVGRIDQVLTDGAPLPPTSYRVDNGRELVRTDGGDWPLCQDMAADITQEGTFAVTYVRGMIVGPVGAYVAGLLASEFAKACTGGRCQLPNGVVSLARQGVTMEFATDAFANGITGIREVDAYTARFNPNRMRSKPAVYSPDLPQVRQTTWSP